MLLLTMKYIEDFHNAMLVDKEYTWSDELIAHRERVVREEFEEFIEALRSGNKLKTVCEGIDLIITVLGTFAQGAIKAQTVQTVFERIMAVNMRKLPPEHRYSKFIKGEDWKPADFSDIEV